jgi:uncharacterized protein
VNPLEAFIRADDLTSLQASLQENPKAIGQLTSLGVSPILHALYLSKARIAEALRNAKGSLDISEAAAMGDRHEVDRLLELDPHAHREVSPDGFHPLGYAAYFGHRELAHDLLEHGAEPNVASENDLRVMPLHSALSGGHKEIVRDLVEHGADVNVAAGSEWTPLHYVAAKGDIETTRLLIEHGATSTSPNVDGKTPRDLAIEKGHTDLAELLPTA